MSKPTRWSPEPWRIYKYEDHPAVDIDSGPYNVAEDVVEINAERIVACVNACTGIENPDAIPELIAALKKADTCLEQGYIKKAQADISNALAKLGRGHE